METGVVMKYVRTVPWVIRNAHIHCRKMCSRQHFQDGRRGRMTQYDLESLGAAARAGVGIARVARWLEGFGELIETAFVYDEEVQRRQLPQQTTQLLLNHIGAHRAAGFHGPDRTERAGSARTA